MSILFQNKRREAEKNCRIQKGTPYDADNNKRPSKDRERKRERERDIESKKKRFVKMKHKRTKKREDKKKNIGTMWR